MSLITIMTIAVALAMDAFSVAIVVSVMLGKASRRQIFRLSFHFGLFQALMPVVGFGAGTSIRAYIESWDHWVAFILLSAIGVRSIVQGLRTQAPAAATGDPTRGLLLIGLAMATSVDALAVGLSFAALRVSVVLPALVTGVVTACLTVVGMAIGSWLGLRFGRRVECFGGLVLVVIAIRILVSHLA